jgi:hypothetical protein
MLEKVSALKAQDNFRACATRFLINGRYFLQAPAPKSLFEFPLSDAPYRRGYPRAPQNAIVLT